MSAVATFKKADISLFQSAAPSGNGSLEILFSVSQSLDSKRKDLFKETAEGNGKWVDPLMIDPELTAVSVSYLKP